MTVLRDSLDELGKINTAPSNLDFSVQINIRHNEGNSDICSFSDTYIDIRRFEIEKNGKMVFEDCQTVIEKILQPFNAVIRQSGGKYWIKSYAEKETPYWEIPWYGTGDTGIKKTAISSIDISNCEYKRSGELSKISPVKELNIIQRQRYLGEEILSYDINDYDNWSLSFPDFFIDTDGTELIIQRSEQPENLGDIFTGHMITDSFLISDYSEGDYILFRFTHKWQWNTNAWIRFRVGQFIDGVLEKWSAYKTVFFQENTFGVTSMFTWPVIKEGNYQFKIELNVVVDDGSGTTGTAVDFGFQMFLWGFDLKAYRGGDSLFDISHIFTQTGKRAVEKEIWFLDADNVNHINAFLYKSAGVYNATTYWNRGVNRKLIRFLAFDFLRLNNKYRDHIRLDVKSDNIKPSDIIKIGSKYYIILSFSRDYFNKLISLTLSEYVDAEIPISGQHGHTLNTIDGNNQDIVFTLQKQLLPPGTEFQAASEAQVRATSEAELQATSEAGLQATSEAELQATSEAELQATSEAELQATNEAELQETYEAEIEEVEVQELTRDDITWELQAQVMGLIASMNEKIEELMQEQFGTEHPALTLEKEPDLDRLKVTGGGSTSSEAGGSFLIQTWDTVRPEMTFLGWTVEDGQDNIVGSWDSTEKQTSITIDGNVTLKANWE